VKRAREARDHVSARDHHVNCARSLERIPTSVAQRERSLHPAKRMPNPRVASVPILCEIACISRKRTSRLSERASRMRGQASLNDVDASLER
jgi:hypothetical protein